MKYLKYALIFFFVVDALIFVTAQVSPRALVSLLPQFDVAGGSDLYLRLVGVLFLSLGLARLYGGIYAQERGAMAVSIWSWVVELTYTVGEILRGQFAVSENLMALVLAPAMLVWSLLYYRRVFLSKKAL